MKNELKYGNISFNSKIVGSMSKSQFIDKFLKTRYFKRYKKEHAIEILEDIYSQCEKTTGGIKETSKESKAKKDDGKRTDKKDK